MSAVIAENSDAIVNIINEDIYRQGRTKKTIQQEIS
jgi:hypothetical protein